MRNRQMFCDRRSYLCGIAIGCLSSADDQVRAADHLDPLCQRIRGGKHIGSCTQEKVELEKPHCVDF